MHGSRCYKFFENVVWNGLIWEKEESGEWRCWCVDECDGLWWVTLCDATTRKVDWRTDGRKSTSAFLTVIHTLIISELSYRTVYEVLPVDIYCTLYYRTVVRKNKTIWKWRTAARTANWEFTLPYRYLYIQSDNHHRHHEAPTVSAIVLPILIR